MNGLIVIWLLGSKISDLGPGFFCYFFLPPIWSEKGHFSQRLLESKDILVE